MPRVRAAESGRSLRDELAADARIELSAEEIERALDPAEYLGSARGVRGPRARGAREEEQWVMTRTSAG